MDSAISVRLNVPQPIRDRAWYSLRYLAEITGVPLRMGDEARGDRIDLVYGAADFGRPSALAIPCDPGAYVRGAESYTHHHLEGLQLWGPTNFDPQRWDPVGATFRLLTFMDEAHVPADRRDRRGIFRTTALPQARQETCAVPLIENHARILLRRLLALRPDLDKGRIPRWPDGKKYALLLSHDTDAITMSSWLEMCLNLGKGLLRRDVVSLRMFRDAFAYIGRPNQNPLFGFPTWKRIENPNARSCFYLFARSPKLKKDVHDCRSTVVDQAIDWNLLRTMADEGWEFGLHAPIHAKTVTEAFVWGKEFIENHLGRPVVGMRHHYWALDWHRPHVTFRKHMEAGFQYDSSIAWRDREGFRAGTCLPFQPFDSDANELLDFYEIPAGLMDRHILGDGQPLQAAIERADRFIHTVKEANGVAFLDWHTEYACNAYRFQGYVTALLKILAPVLTDSECWITTPSALLAYWKKRKAALESAAEVESFASAKS